MVTNSRARVTYNGHRNTVTGSRRWEVSGSFPGAAGWLSNPQEGSQSLRAVRREVPSPAGAVVSSPAPFLAGFASSPRGSAPESSSCRKQQVTEPPGTPSASAELSRPFCVLFWCFAFFVSHFHFGHFCTCSHVPSSQGPRGRLNNHSLQTTPTPDRPARISSGSPKPPVPLGVVGRVTWWAGAPKCLPRQSHGVPECLLLLQPTAPAGTNPALYHSLSRVSTPRDTGQHIGPPAAWAKFAGSLWVRIGEGSALR